MKDILNKLTDKELIELKQKYYRLTEITYMNNTVMFKAYRLNLCYINAEIIKRGLDNAIL